MTEWTQPMLPGLATRETVMVRRSPAPVERYADCRALRSLVKTLEAHEWTYRTTYTRATGERADGEPVETVGIIAHSTLTGGAGRYLNVLWARPIGAGRWARGASWIVGTVTAPDGPSPVYLSVVSVRELAVWIADERAWTDAHLADHADHWKGEQ